MKFCPECNSYMVHSTTTGSLMFHCRCGNIIQAEPEDTLLSEEYVEAASSNRKFTTFIENSPKDPSGLTVKKDCPECGLDFMTQIRVGEQESVLYTCLCGARFTQLDLDSMQEVGKEESSNIAQGAGDAANKNIKEINVNDLENLSFEELLALIS